MGTTWAYSFTKGRVCKGSFTSSKVVGSQCAVRRCRGDMTMYNSPGDIPNPFSSNEGSVDMWSALASTERWIEKTLSSAEGKSNPLQRKEVKYVCETEENLECIVAGIFRRLREARELGDEHGRLQKGLGGRAKTMRETVVVVIPSSRTLMYSFQFFDALVKRINAARRNARDLHTTQKSNEWVTSVSMAALHPRYGIPTPQETLQRELQEEADGEVDLNLQDYRDKQLRARRSPYPTLVIETRSSPPILGPKLPNPIPLRNPHDQDVTKEHLNQLENLFSKSASFDHPIEEPTDKLEDAFYASIANVKGIHEISFKDPVLKAQIWAQGNLPYFQPKASEFHTNTATHPDHAYQFVFTQIANHRSHSKSLFTYLVLPHFCTSSATSFEKFANEVVNIVKVMPVPDLGFDGVDVLHPEHILKQNRAPVPVLVLKWKY